MIPAEGDKIDRSEQIVCADLMEVVCVQCGLENPAYRPAAKVVSVNGIALLRMRLVVALYRLYRLKIRAAATP
jgi:hypothetical protein